MEFIDSHAHIFTLDQPLVGDRRYTPPTPATQEQYLHALASHGFARGVLVQPSFLGTNNAFMVAALQRHPERFRGVAVVDSDVPEATLDDLVAAGVVGIRLNLIGRELPELRSPQWQRFLVAIAARNLHVEVHCRAHELSSIASPILERGLQLVVDHFGRPDPARGVNDSGFRYLLTLAETGQVWVKLSGAYRNGDDGERHALEAVALLREAFGLRRLVWGSDWPHTQFETQMHYGTTVTQLHAWLPDPDERTVVIQDAPAQLYGWAAGHRNSL